MFSEPLKAAFRGDAHADTSLIERIMSQFYAELSAGWNFATVIDGGAHIGFHTFRLAAQTNVRWVFAVEANQRTYYRLKAAVAKSVNRRRIATVWGALQDDHSRADVPFFCSSSHPGRSGINPLMRSNIHTKYTNAALLPAMTIDRIAVMAPTPVRFIKLDVEGSEFAALRGATATLAAARPVLMMEAGPDTPALNGYTPDELAAFFERLGYRMLTVFCEPWTANTIGDFWYAWAVAREQADGAIPVMSGLIRQHVERTGHSAEDAVDVH